MNYNVELTTQAQLDLQQIIEYCASKVDSAFAEKKLVEIEQAPKPIIKRRKLTLKERIFGGEVQEVA